MPMAANKARGADLLATLYQKSCTKSAILFYYIYKRQDIRNFHQAVVQINKPCQFSDFYTFVKPLSAKLKLHCEMNI